MRLVTCDLSVWTLEKREIQKRIQEGGGRGEWQSLEELRVEKYKTDQHVEVRKYVVRDAFRRNYITLKKKDIYVIFIYKNINYSNGLMIGDSQEKVQLRTR